MNDHEHEGQSTFIRQIEISALSLQTAAHYSYNHKTSLLTKCS